MAATACSLLYLINSFKYIFFTFKVCSTTFSKILDLLLLCSLCLYNTVGLNWRKITNTINLLTSLVKVTELCIFHLSVRCLVLFYINWFYMYLKFRSCVYHPLSCLRNCFEILNYGNFQLFCF